jgi:hypothetical protein
MKDKGGKKRSERKCKKETQRKNERKRGREACYFID